MVTAFDERIKSMNEFFFLFLVQDGGDNTTSYIQYISQQVVQNLHKDTGQGPCRGDRRHEGRTYDTKTKWWASAIEFEIL